MPKCISEGCDRPTRAREFNVNNNGKKYHEARCGVCQNLMKKYKLTGPARDSLLAGQGGCCAICKSEIHPKKYGHTSRDAAVVDHCHITQRVRGILCGQCNVALGNFGDSIDRLRSAIHYLKSGDN